MKFYQRKNFFKMKSGTVNDILDNILNLRKLKQETLADAYEQEFQVISAKEDLIQLILLKKELESEVGRIKGDAL